ncbi:MAG TPA: heavy metal-associated domain-containing protein [Terriglobales bacterium]
MCAHAVRVSLKGVPGVDSVVVSLNQGLASVKLKAGNTVTMEQLRKAVEKNGFVTKQAEVTVRGQLLFSGKPRLQVLGTDETYDLTPANGSVPANWQELSGKTVIVVGSVPAATKGNKVKTMEVKSVTPAPQTNP